MDRIFDIPFHPYILFIVMSWLLVGCIMLLIVNLWRKKKTKKILKAVPCQRATNLFDVGLKSLYFYKKKNLEKLFTGPGTNILTWIL